MSSGESLVEPPSTPTPSTSDLSITQPQTQQQQIQGVKEAFKISDSLYSAVFSILWLFGLARNLASYVVSLGIIPLRTATRLFGIKAHPQQQPHPNPNANTRVKAQSTRHQTRSTDKSTLDKRHAWTTHKSSKPSGSSIVSASASVSITRTGSVPSTPQTRRISLQPIEAATDSEQIAHRPRNRRAPGSSSSRRIVFQDTVANEEGDLVESNGRTRSRSRVDHTTRRILFVDSKHSRRQTAPPVPYQSSGSAPAPEMTESPVQESNGLPEPDTQQEPSSTPRPKSTPEQSTSRPNTNEFGEFVSAPPPTSSQNTCFPGDQERDVASGTESTSERKSRGKDRLRSLFGKKRSSSVASNGETHEACPLIKSHIKNGSNRLRRKSPYPAAAVVTAPPVTVSDAESSTSGWLRSRPRKLSRKARSNSLSEGSRVQPPATPLPPISPPSTADILSQNTTPLPQSPLPLFRSSTMASTSTSTSATSSSTPGTPGAHKRSSGGPSNFNPLRELEARLYRHGVGTGPAHDALTYVTTPVPKMGIKRTNPYALLGMERPSSTSSPRSSRMGQLSAPTPPRRVSAPAEESIPQRPVTPRSHTQPL